MERLSLSNAAFEGDNNVYLFADGPETVLIDTGDWMEQTRDQLASGLEARGLAFEDIDRVLLSHWHHDHTGLAGEIQARSGATVHVHAADAPLVGGDEEQWAALRAQQSEYFDAWGIPDAKQAILQERFYDPDLADAPRVTPFEDGHRFAINDTTLRAVHTPGHAAGLCMFETTIDGRSEVFSSDALLPVYTPNVGGADVRMTNPLAKYLRALRGIVAADYERAWPGHREPIDDPAARAETIIEHHEVRAWRVLSALAEHGPLDPWEVSAELFGELEGIHILHGPGEAVAHLEHLAASGDVVANGDVYRLADGLRSRLERGDVERWDLEF